MLLLGPHFLFLLRFQLLRRVPSLLLLQHQCLPCCPPSPKEDLLLASMILFRVFSKKKPFNVPSSSHLALALCHLFLPQKVARPPLAKATAASSSQSFQRGRGSCSNKSSIFCLTHTVISHKQMCGNFNANICTWVLEARTDSSHLRRTMASPQAGAGNRGWMEQFSLFRHSVL